MYFLFLLLASGFFIVILFCRGLSSAGVFRELIHTQTIAGKCRFTSQEFIGFSRISAVSFEFSCWWEAMLLPTCWSQFGVSPLKFLLFLYCVTLQTRCERLCGTCSSSANKSADQNLQIADNFNTHFNLPSRSWKNSFRKHERWLNWLKTLLKQALKTVNCNKKA